MEPEKNFLQSPNVFNPLQPSVAFLYPLKTSENLTMRDIEKQHRAVMGYANIDLSSISQISNNHQ